MEAQQIDQELSEWLQIFLNATDRRDFPVLVEGVQLFVNKYQLAGCSPVFEKAIIGDCKEAHENQLKLPDKTLGEILELFACLLAPSGRCRKEVSHKNLVVLWKLAAEYFIDVWMIDYKLDWCNYVNLYCFRKYLIYAKFFSNWNWILRQKSQL